MRDRRPILRQEAHESLVVERECLEYQWRCACQTKAVHRGLLAQIRDKDRCALSAFSYLWICLFTLQSKSGTCGDSLQGLKTGRVAWRTRLALFYCRLRLSCLNPHISIRPSQPSLLASHVSPQWRKPHARHQAFQCMPSGNRVAVAVQTWRPDADAHLSRQDGDDATADPTLAR